MSTTSHPSHTPSAPDSTTSKSTPESTIVEIKTRAITDYWRKPPSIDTSNAPSVHTRSHSSLQFHSARVTVSADWTRLYDQGGILVHLPITVGGGKRCWVKTGIEFVGGEPKVSVVAAREWADWSLTSTPPNPSPNATNTTTSGSSKSVTIDLVREPIDKESGKGSSLFVHLVQIENGKMRREEVPIREVTWAFEQEGEIEIGLYAARPTKVPVDGVDDSELAVKFESFMINDELQV